MNISINTSATQTFLTCRTPAELSVPDVLVHGGSEVWGSDREEKSLVFCRTCEILIGEVITLINDGASPDAIFNASVNVCVGLNISNQVFCENMVELAKVRQGISVLCLIFMGFVHNSTFIFYTLIVDLNNKRLTLLNNNNVSYIRLSGKV